MPFKQRKALPKELKKTLSKNFRDDQDLSPNLYSTECI